MATVSPIDLTGTQIDQQGIDRQRAIAALMQQNSLSAPEGQMISGHYVAPSITQYAAKIAQALSAASMNKDLDAQSRALQVQGMKNLMGYVQPDQAPQQSQPQVDPAAQALAQGAAQGSVGPTVANAQRMDQMPPQAPTMAGGAAGTSNPFGVQSLMRSKALEMLGGAPAASAYWDSQKLPDTVKTNNYYGLDKNSVADAMRRENAAKGQTLVREDSTLTRTNPDGSISGLFTAPGIKTGSLIDWSSGQPVAKELPGMAGITQKMAAAKTAGEGTALPFSGVDSKGNPLPVTNRTAAATQQNFPRIDTAKNDNDFASMARSIIANPESSAADKADAKQYLGAHGGGAIYAEAPLGTKTGAENQQSELSKKYSDLSSQNSQAATTNSYLQSIKNLADKGGVGAFSDKVQFTNNLLSYAGISDKATDAVTAKNLLDKYSNQITARLGGGANGSDARSAIIAAAYPNSHMTPAAIKEAVDNLVAANKMTQSKTALLTPHANARDPVTYNQKEQVFDTNADPRLWQLHDMTPAQQSAYVRSLSPQDAADLMKKRQALKQLGVF